MMFVGHAIKVAARRVGCFVWLASLVGVIAGCANVSSSLGLGSSEKAKPAELAVNVPKLAVRMAWSSKLNAINFPLDVSVAGVNATDSASINVASGDGVVVSFDAATGRELWRAQAGKNLAAGVGAEGATVAVVTQANELLSFENGRELWRLVSPRP
jgi:outer membrane protein assembly factor BamB